MYKLQYVVCITLPMLKTVWMSVPSITTMVTKISSLKTTFLLQQKSRCLLTLLFKKMKIWFDVTKNITIATHGYKQQTQIFLKA